MFNNKSFFQKTQLSVFRLYFAISTVVKSANSLFIGSLRVLCRQYQLSVLGFFSLYFVFFYCLSVVNNYLY